jgi:hypothetical protein
MTRINAIVMTALCAAVLCGCSKDDDNNITLDGETHGSLVGTWSASNIAATKTDGTQVDKATAPTWKELLTINTDGTFSYTSTYGTSVISGNGTWSAKDNAITFSGSTKSFMFDVDGDTMIFAGTVSAGSYALTWDRQ